MKTAPALLVASLCVTSAMACDKVEAARVQLVMAEMGAQWSERAGRITLEWGREWEGMAAGRRLELLRAFAEGDGCLAGMRREISFYRMGKLVGTASPWSGVQLSNEAAAPRAAAPVPVAAAAACPQ